MTKKVETKLYGNIYPNVQGWVNVHGLSNAVKSRKRSQSHASRNQQNQTATVANRSQNVSV